MIRSNEMKKITVFKRSQALVRDFELKWIQKRGRVIQNGDVRDVDGTHRKKPERSCGIVV